MLLKKKAKNGNKMLQQNSIFKIKFKTNDIVLVFIIDISINNYKLVVNNNLYRKIGKN